MLIMSFIFHCSSIKINGGQWFGRHGLIGGNVVKDDSDCIGYDVATGDVGNDRMTFEEALEALMNDYSRENDSNTPDFILAIYLRNCLDAFNSAVNSRDEFYGEDHSMPKDTK